jgi:hypothetical protein
VLMSTHNSGIDQGIPPVQPPRIIERRSAFDSGPFP